MALAGMVCENAAGNDAAAGEGASAEVFYSGAWTASAADGIALSRLGGDEKCLRTVGWGGIYKVQRNCF